MFSVDDTVDFNNQTSGGLLPLIYEKAPGNYFGYPYPSQKLYKWLYAKDKFIVFCNREKNYWIFSN